ncbi:hypothetical protein [Nocardia sp. X0981]
MAEEKDPVFEEIEYPFKKDPLVTPNGDGFLLRPISLHADLVKLYAGPDESFATSVVGNWLMFGDLKGKDALKKNFTPIPKMGKASVGGSSRIATNYGETVTNLDKAADNLDKKQQAVLQVMEKLSVLIHTGKQNTAALIHGVNTKMSEMHNFSDVAFLETLTEAYSAAIWIVEENALENQRLAGEVPDPEVEDDDKKARDALDRAVDRFEEKANDPRLNPDDVVTPDLFDPAKNPDLSVGDPDTPGTPSADLKDSVADMQNRNDDALQAATNPANSPGYNPAYNPGMGAGGLGSMGALGGAMNSLFPLLAGQLAARGMADPDSAGRVQDIDPSRYDRAAAPTMPPARQAATTPWSTQAAATPAQAQPAQHQTAGAPSGTTSTQPGTGMPKRAVGDDGLVAYQFPGRDPIRVSPVVAQALDKARDNKNSTDAQAAYADTPAAWTDPKDIGRPADPFELASGDVATWTIRSGQKDEGSKVPSGDPTPGGPASGDQKSEDKKSEAPTGDTEYRTAVLVKFGEGESATLEAVVMGELQPFAEDMGDAHGPFGDFAGLKRPKNVEATGAKGQDTEGAATGTDQPAGDMPALSASI